MFKFDETLFNLSSLYIDDSLDILVSKKDTINEITTISDYAYSNHVNNTCNDVSEVIKKLSDLHTRILDANKIMKIVNYDDNLMSSILGYDKTGLGKFTSFSLDLFGDYGCNQSTAITLYKRYMMDPDSLSDYERQKIENIKSVLENFDYLKSSTDNEFLFLLEYAANGGCGFATNSNILIDLYSNIENGEERFKEKYNIPLYNELNNTKYYNYEALFIALLLNKTKRNMNHDIRDFFGIQHEDDHEYIPGFSDELVMSDFGVGAHGFYTFQIIGNLEKELVEDFDVESITTRAANLDTYTKNILNYDYCSIEAQNYKLNPYGPICTSAYGGVDISSRSGHSMVVVGISPNGKFLVSSWGFMFELDRFKRANLNFFKVGEKSVE